MRPAREVRPWSPRHVQLTDTPGPPTHAGDRVGTEWVADGVVYRWTGTEWTDHGHLMPQVHAWLRATFPPS